jgi:poly-D-alanine transfer protein DltD
MHVNTKEDYEPGVLKDVMHLGSYGWMKINMFLEKQYHEEQNN